MKLICECGYQVNEKFTRTYFLADNKKFTRRTLKFGYCWQCHTQIAELSEKRISDDTVFKNLLKGEQIDKYLFREKKNILHIEYGQSPKFKGDWIYGTNKEIKNRKGEILEVRQYATDFNGKKELIKSIVNGKRIQ